MSWKPMSRAKALSGNAKVVTGVALSGIKRKVSKICLVVRPPILGNPAWMTVGARIAVLEGDGEHAGMLRVTPSPGGGFQLAKAGGRATIGTLMVFLPWPEGVTPMQHASTAVDFDYGEGRLELTLPAWSRPPAPGLVAAAVAATAAREKAGYVGITARMPDPAAADRAAARRAGAP
jgi:hypothetical protein